MAEKTAVKIEKTDLEKALDGALIDLKKAASGDTLEKSGKKDEEKEEAKGEEPFKGADGKGDGDEKESGKGSAETDDSKGDDEDEDEKARKEGYRKGVENDLTKSAAVKTAVEVSKFLGEFVKSMSEIVGDMKNEISALKKSNVALSGALVKSFESQNEITKSFASELATFGGRPLARKTVPAGAKIETLAKSTRADEETGVEGQGDLSKSQIAGKLADLEMTNKVPMGTTSKFEAAGIMSKAVEGLVFGKSE
jgi:hypothetical protein